MSIEPNTVESLFIQAFCIVVCALLVGCFVEKKLKKS